MGPSAQNSSSVHLCRRRVRFNEVPGKVPEKVWEALVQAPGQVQQGSGEGRLWCRRRVRFNKVPEKVPEKVPGSLGAKPSQIPQEKVPKVPEKVWEALVQSQVRFNRVPKKVPEKVPGGKLWCRAGSGSTGFRRRFRGQVQQGSAEGSGEGVGGFGAERGHVQQGSGGGSGQGSGEGLGGSGAEPGQVQQGSEKVLEKVWETLVQSQVRFNRICGHLIHGNPAEVFPALGFARFRKVCKNKMLRLLGKPPKLISSMGYLWGEALLD